MEGVVVAGGICGVCEIIWDCLCALELVQLMQKH